jgi:hypothetical protein
VERIASQRQMIEVFRNQEAVGVMDTHKSNGLEPLAHPYRSRTEADGAGTCQP